MSKSSKYNPRVVKTQGIIRHYGWLNREQGPKMDLKFAGESWNLVQRRLHGMEGREGALPPRPWANGNIQWGAQKGPLQGFQSGNCVYAKLVVNYPYVGIDIKVMIPRPGPIPWPPFPPDPFRYCQDLWDANESISYLENADNRDKQVYPDVGFDILECWKMTCAILWTQHPQHDDNRVMANASLVVWPGSLADGDIADCWDYEEKPDDVADGPTPIDGDEDDEEKDIGGGLFIPTYEITIDEGAVLPVFIPIDRTDHDWKDQYKAFFPLELDHLFTKNQSEQKGITPALAKRWTLSPDRTVKRYADPSKELLTEYMRIPNTIREVEDDEAEFVFKGLGEATVIDYGAGAKWDQSWVKMKYRTTIQYPELLDFPKELPVGAYDQDFLCVVDGVWRYGQGRSSRGGPSIHVMELIDRTLPEMKLEYTCLIPDENHPDGERIEVSYRKLSNTSWIADYGGFTICGRAPWLSSSTRTLRAQRISNDTWVDAFAPTGFTPSVALSGLAANGSLWRLSSIEAYQKGTFWWPTSGPIDVRRQFSEVGPPGPPEPSEVAASVMIGVTSDPSDGELTLDIPYQKWYLWQSTGNHWEGLSCFHYATFGVKVIGLWDE